ncbi:MAG: thiol-disulfide oxidoreductase DCC family protein [Candidatus Hodarchaeales archaeon]|jgi:predicted DCC family thiol-disulfide oxidoreductase YuxK
MKISNPNVIIFDGDCGLCNAFRKFVKQLDKNNLLLFRPYQNRKYLKKYRISQDEAGKELYLIKANNEIFKGSIAVFKVITFLPSFWKALGQVGVVFSPIIEPFYRIIANKRHFISQKLGMTACTKQ